MGKWACRTRGLENNRGDVIDFKTRKNFLSMNCN